MKRFWMAVALVGFTAAFTGCKPSTAPAPAPVLGHQFPTQAQGRLPILKLWIGPKVMDAEMALSSIEEETGMMFRTNMAENDGMIFVFDRPTQASFWMLNTLLPLSAAYIAPDGTILEIHDLQPKDTNAVVAQTANIQFVLETKQGWFKSNNINVGTVISTDRGSLNKVFFAPH